MNKQEQAAMRRDLLELLSGGGAHLSFDEAVANLDPALRGAKVTGVPHTPWRLIEHMRLAQHDILAFSREADWQSPPWPEGYWPEGDEPENDAAWEACLSVFQEDLASMRALVADESTDLLSPITGGDGQTIFREAMLLADHNAYHLGQLVVLRRALRAWAD